MKKVLIIDDRHDVLESFCEWFEEEYGETPLTALNVADAIAHFKLYDIDFVISDYELPDGNGMEVLNYINAHSIQCLFILFSGRYDLKCNLSGPFVEAILDKNYEKLFQAVVFHRR